jgi:nucleotide-binding universal stress UspA family protein
MYNKVLVPLDGSPFSQCSLDHVRTISRGCNVPEVVLLRVIEPLSSSDIAGLSRVGGDSITQLVKANEAEAKEYISTIAKRLSEEGLSVKGEVVSGKADEAIVDYARKNGIDLIIMSSHGRSGVSRWVMGSVADRVMRSSIVPVLLVPTPGCRVAHGF